MHGRRTHIYFFIFCSRNLPIQRSRKIRRIARITFGCLNAVRMFAMAVDWPSHNLDICMYVCTNYQAAYAILLLLFILWETFPTIENLKQRGKCILCSECLVYLLELKIMNAQCIKPSSYIFTIGPSRLAVPCCTSFNLAGATRIKLIQVTAA